MANVFELDMTLKDIEANPELHHQEWWGRQWIGVRGEVCGTTMCAAGFTVVRHGYVLEFTPENSRLMTAGTCVGPDGERGRIEDIARRILDLDKDQAEHFFHFTNSLDDLQKLRDLFAERPNTKEG